MNTKPHNVTCRISSFRKKYGLNIACTSSGSVSSAASGRIKVGNGSAGPAAGVISGRVTKVGVGATGGKKNGAGVEKGKKKAAAADSVPEIDGRERGDGKEEKNDDGDAQLSGDATEHGNGTGAAGKARAVEVLDEGVDQGVVKREKIEDEE